MVRDQARPSGLPMPKVYEIHTDPPNAFDTGRSPKSAVVAVPTGIRRALNREELSADLAHEMAHLCNRYTLIMAVVASFAGAISMLVVIAQFPAVFGGMLRGRASRDNIIGLLVLAFVMPKAATLVRAAVSRTRELQVDAIGTHNCGNPLALATALQKLERGSEVLPVRVSEGASRLFIVNPLRGATFASLFPPVRKLKSA